MLLLPFFVAPWFVHGAFVLILSVHTIDWPFLNLQQREKFAPLRIGISLSRTVQLIQSSSDALLSEVMGVTFYLELYIVKPKLRGG